ncbi:MAG: L,D-transpeptidase [Mycobacteriales bacterium]
MTPLDRYRERRNDPYRGYYGSRRAWTTRLGIGLPLVLSLVIVLNLVVAAERTGVAKARDLGRSADLGYQALLVPSAVAPKFVVPGAQQANGGRSRSVMAARGAGSTATGPSRAGHAYGSRVSYRTDANGYRVAPARDVAMVPTTTWLAHLEHSKRGYPSANALQSNRKVPGSWYGYPSILPVIDATQDRMRVRLAQRPDESTSWITRSGVVMSRTHWAILVNISQHWLYVFKNGIEQASYPVGTGARGTPTPTGSYFLAFHAPPNGPGYGSQMLETSAHSKVIAHFEGGNDAIIAIHGPISYQSDREIGNHGAAISNGCIRMHDRDLNHVKHVPNGAPIILTD